MNAPKKYICQVNFNLGGTLLYDSEENCEAPASY